MPLPGGAPVRAVEVPADSLNHRNFKITLFDRKERQKTQIEKDGDFDDGFEARDKRDLGRQTVALTAHIVAGTSPNHSLLLNQMETRKRWRASLARF